MYTSCCTHNKNSTGSSNNSSSSGSGNNENNSGSGSTQAHIVLSLVFLQSKCPGEGDVVPEAAAR